MASKYPSLSPYNYVSNNPIRLFDPDGRIIRDSNGKIIFTPVGSPMVVTHPGAPSSPAAVQPGFIQADDGTNIDAFQNQSIDRRFDTDCHGVTFADGEYWINNDQVNYILTGDNYQISENAQVGDIAIYTDENGNVVHSATVVKVDAKTGEVTVEGLGGLETETHQDNVKDGWSDPNATVTYYRKNENQQEKDKEEKKE